MYFKDLNIVRERGRYHVKVGFLDLNKFFRTGSVPKEFVEKLKKHATERQYKGWHTCPFCKNAKGYSDYLLHIRKDRYYQMPELIVHYIQQHNYQPPKVFVDFVMSL